MKKILLSALVLIIWCLLIYLVFSFCQWQINAKYWSWDARYFYVCFGFIIGLFISIAFYNLPNE